MKFPCLTLRKYAKLSKVGLFGEYHLQYYLFLRNTRMKCFHLENKNAAEGTATRGCAASCKVEKHLDVVKNNFFCTSAISEHNTGSLNPSIFSYCPSKTAPELSC